MLSRRCVVSLLQLAIRTSVCELCSCFRGALDHDATPSAYLQPLFLVFECVNVADCITMCGVDVVMHNEPAGAGNPLMAITAGVVACMYFFAEKLDF